MCFTKLVSLLSRLVVCCLIPSLVLIEADVRWCGVPGAACGAALASFASVEIDVADGRVAMACAKKAKLSLCTSVMHPAAHRESQLKQCDAGNARQRHHCNQQAAGLSQRDALELA